MATFRGFSWKKVPIFIFSQLLGGIVGAAVTYANYIHAIDLFEGGRSVRTVPGSAAIFGTYAVRCLFLSIYYVFTMYMRSSRFLT